MLIVNFNNKYLHHLSKLIQNDFILNGLPSDT